MLYRFVHALVRSALYDTLSATRRAQLHLRVADAFQPEIGEAAPRLAHHLLACAPSGGSTRTASACLAAGDWALSVLADAEAGDWYAQGLGFVSDEDDPDLRIDLLTGLGEAQRRTGDAASRQTLLDASRLAAGGGDVRPPGAGGGGQQPRDRQSSSATSSAVGLIDTALDLVGPAASAERAELLSLQAAALAVGGDHERVLRVADEAAAIAARLDDVALRARIGVRHVLACLVPDRVTAQASESTDLVGWADATGDPKLRVLSRRPPALLAAGALAEARRRTAEAMAIADETGQLGTARRGHHLLRHRDRRPG